jgi:cytochrome c5
LPSAAAPMAVAHVENVRLPPPGTGRTPVPRGVDGLQRGRGVPARLGPGRNMTTLWCLSFVLAAAAPAAAQDRERSGKEVVAAVCDECHGTGAKGAPKIGDRDAWARLASQGLTELTESAINGVRRMPPHGGKAMLTDTEIQRAISYMVNQSGGHWIEPISHRAPPAKRSGPEVVQAFCARCHREGVNGAPKIGDRAAWIPRVKQGFDVLVASAIKGQGPMPPRSDEAGLTDAEIRDAVATMINGDANAAPKPSRAASSASAPNPGPADAKGSLAGVLGWLRQLWQRWW